MRPTVSWRGRSTPGRARRAAWSPSASWTRHWRRWRRAGSWWRGSPGSHWAGSCCTTRAPRTRSRWPSTRAGRNGWTRSRPGWRPDRNGTGGAPGSPRSGRGAWPGWTGRGEALALLAGPIRALRTAPAWAPNYTRTACEVAEVLWLLDRRDHLARWSSRPAGQGAAGRLPVPDDRRPARDGAPLRPRRAPRRGAALVRRRARGPRRAGGPAAAGRRRPRRGADAPAGRRDPRPRRRTPPRRTRSSSGWG